MNILGAVLKDQRTAVGKSAREICNELNYPGQIIRRISNMENNRTIQTIPSEYLDEIAREIGCDQLLLHLANAATLFNLPWDYKKIERIVTVCRRADKQL